MSEEQYPLPWNPDEACKIDNKLIQTRLDQYPEVEVDGTLFNRDCDGLDNTIPRRKDKFITICPDELPDVPKEMLKNKHFETVPFPGVISTEIPKALMAQLLGCCLKDRTAGFDFEAEEELDDNGDKVELDFEDSNNPVTKAFTVQFGTEGYSYLRIGLNIKPDLCFCDEDCGDEDYIHLRVNFGIEYHDEDDDPIQDPDLVIEDEQLSNLIARFGGGGGGGNPLCSRKFFGVYLGGNLFVPDNLESPTVNDYVYALKAPYLSDLQLVENGIYKVEYFCEYDSWYVTDGQCSNVTPVASYPSYRYAEITGLADQTYTGTFFLDNNETSLYTYDQFSITLDSTASTTTPADAFNNGITWTALSGNAERLHYSFSLKEAASGTLVYTALISHSSGSCDQKAFKLIFKLTAIEEEEPVEEEEE